LSENCLDENIALQIVLIMFVMDIERREQKKEE